MKKLTTILLLALAAFACTPENEHPWNDDWDTPDDPPKPEPVLTAKPRYVWIDAGANFDDYGNSRERIKEDCKKIAQTGFSDIIVDVRPTTGDVLFESAVAPALKRIDKWRGSSYVWAERTADFDYLQAFIEEGHAAGLKVHAAMNTLVGGYQCPYGLGREGMVYSDESKRDWCTVQNREGGLANCLDDPEYGARFLNPANKDVQAFVLSLVAELAAYKDLDGIVLDRCRYDDSGLMSDFSPASRKAFEQYIGQTVSSWPSAIFAPGTESLGSAVSSLQRQWLTFRAKTIHDLMEKAAAKAHEVNPSILFGVYVGAWYSTYYTCGVNWASPSYNCKTEYLWASADYQAAGFADHLDYIFLGAYAGADQIHGTTEWTMEGFCRLGAKRLASAVPYAAGPDIGNASGFTEGGKGSLMPEIVKTCMANSDGLFIFDLCHIKMYDYWSSLKTGIDAYLKTINNQ
jgi:uncharacterized lipoprotein YddW (UPF0748 family)